jgi:hypothetical protein
VLLLRFAAWSWSPRARPPVAGSLRAPFCDAGGAGGGDLSQAPSRAGESSVSLLYDSLSPNKIPRDVFRRACGFQLGDSYWLFSGGNGSRIA